jgi:tryptophan-rich sensory protein
MSSPPSSRSSLHTWLGLAGWLAVTFLAAAAASQFGAGAWYDSLAKPAWTPPSAVFGPVWAVLYTLMGIAAWLVWRREGLRAASFPLGLYVVHLGVNVAWSALFFGGQRIGWALLDIMLLWLFLAFLLALFWRRSRWAGALLVPYLLWVTYAGALNLQILRMNA